VAPPKRRNPCQIGRGFFFLEAPPFTSWLGVLPWEGADCISLFCLPRPKIDKFACQAQGVGIFAAGEILGHPDWGAFCFWALARVIVLNFTIGKGKPLLRIALIHLFRFAAFYPYRSASQGLSYHIFSVALLHFSGRKRYL